MPYKIGVYITMGAEPFSVPSQPMRYTREFSSQDQRFRYYTNAWSGSEYLVHVFWMFIESP